MRTRRKEKEPLCLPKSGSKLRRLYDLLITGDKVPVHRIGLSTSYLTVLRDFYNCELVTKKGIGGYTQMLGRWDGPYFVPLERLQETA